MREICMLRARRRELEPDGSRAALRQLSTLPVAESFFATLEWELIDRCDWRTRDEARLAIFEYIECWYNQKRRHSSLGYLSPVQYEEKLLGQAA